jgi:sulfonate transport system ATP-binding protein
VLRLKNISKRYENGTSALSEINLEIAQHTIVSVVGASGSGKSTLLRIISGLERVSRGDLSWNGQRIDGPRRDIGFIFQEPRLMPWLTVRQNVRLGLGPFPNQRRPGSAFPASSDVLTVPASAGHRTPNASGQEAPADHLISEVVRQVGLEAVAGRWPRELSGGMAQRVAIARVLVARPSLILLDEPFSALDAVNRLKLQNHFLKIWETDRPTLLVVTHDVEEALVFANRVIILEDSGRIKEDFAIDLSRPRNRVELKFHYWKEAILRSMDSSLIGDAKTAEEKEYV